MTSGAFRCGWGGDYCGVQLDRRGLCDEHRDAIRAIDGSEFQRRQAAAQRKLQSVEKQLVRMFAFVEQVDGCTTERLARQFRYGPHDAEARERLAELRRRGWLTLTETGKLVVGPDRPDEALATVPKPEVDAVPADVRRYVSVEHTAAELARFVHSQGGAVVSKPAAAQAVDLAPSASSLNRAVAAAKERGWIVTKLSGRKSGYLPGPQQPPQPSTADSSD